VREGSDQRRLRILEVPTIPGLFPRALAGMIDYIRKGRFLKGQKIVFLHTGGVAGLFAYADILEL